jgi:CRP-like cAMP-binding protein
MCNNGVHSSGARVYTCIKTIDRSFHWICSPTHIKALTAGVCSISNTSGEAMYVPQLAVDRRAAATYPATHNRLLAALPAAEFHRLVPDLEPVALPPGYSVYEPGETMEHAFFPTAGIVSLHYVLADGATTEFALVGNCGMVGISAFMGGESTPSRAVVVSAGHAYRLKRRVLMREFELRGDLQHVLLRYTQALITQTAQTAVCVRHHAVEQRLCRWLLLCLDRQSSNELHVTQELISHMLGVRREGVTEAAGRLQDAGLIRLHRGTITVLDRPGLEQSVCECYAVARREADRLLSRKHEPRASQAARWVGGAFLTA